MTTSRRALVGFLATAVIVLGASVGAAGDARCSDGRWTIDDGPLAIGPLSIATVGLRDGVPVLDAPCRAVRWALGRIEGETRLRALFVCRPLHAARRSRRMALRLRARIVDGCTRMEGAFGTRRFGEIVRFTATLGGDGCASNAECAAEEYCAAPAGDCAARGTCEPRPQACPDNVDPVCGCDRNTYSNPCDAAAAGVRVAHEGECRPGCGGIAGIPCPTGEFCDLPAGLCGAADLDGRCVEISAACPEFYSPVCGCDGVTYANDCFRQAAQAQRAHDGPCVEPDCITNADCGDDAFCAKRLGECAADGRCEARPSACPDVYLPVCGCDGHTYGNRCEAAAAGVSAAHEGECGGCTSLLDCPPNEFCQAPIGACGGPGDCTFIEQVCPNEYDPVCGCDGETYTNRCHAAMRAVSIAHAGACEGVCGGIAGIPCPDGQFCELPAGECHSSDLQGRCVAIGGACPQIYDPVCSCDGKTYPNDCERQQAGAQKSHDGACECVPLCCTLRSEPIDTDGDGCGDTCVATSKCEASCDCYPDPPFGNYKFCEECPLLCPNCGSYWACVDGTCVEQCGQIPPDVTTCFVDRAN